MVLIYLGREELYEANTIQGGHFSPGAGCCLWRGGKLQAGQADALIRTSVEHLNNTRPHPLPQHRYNSSFTLTSWWKHFYDRSEKYFQPVFSETPCRDSRAKCSTGGTQLARQQTGIMSTLGQDQHFLTLNNNLKVSRSSQSLLSCRDKLLY